MPHQASADDRSPFLRLPQEIRDIIYSYVFSVGKGYQIWGVQNGIICLADKPGYSPKLCDITYFHNGHECMEDYLTQDSEFFEPFISRKVETWRMEINQLKYVCKQLRYETRGVMLRINSGTRLIFHGTKSSADSSMMIGSIFNLAGRVSGKAHFVDFWTKCAPKWRMHVRDVEIIELPLNDEQPRHARNWNSNDNGDSRTWMELVLALELRKAFTRQPLSPAQTIEKRAFRRRCAEMTGCGGDSSKAVYQICQTNPSLVVIVRYNELQDGVDNEWLERMCSYRMALRKGDVGIAMGPGEKNIVRELVSRNGGAPRAPSLDNLRMSSSVNMAIMSCNPRYYFLDVPSMNVVRPILKQRNKDMERLFQEGV